MKARHCSCDRKKKKLKSIQVIVELRTKNKEIEKPEQLRDDTARLWNMRKVIAIPVIIGALGCISNCFGSYMEKAGIEVKDNTPWSRKYFKKSIIYVGL